MKWKGVVLAGVQDVTEQFECHFATWTRGRVKRDGTERLGPEVYGDARLTESGKRVDHFGGECDALAFEAAAQACEHCVVAKGSGGVRQEDLQQEVHAHSRSRLERTERERERRRRHGRRKRRNEVAQGFAQTRRD